MEITNIPSTEPEEAGGPVQEAKVLRREGLSDTFDDKTIRSAEVTFRPGERTKFHVHEGIQVLFITNGSGMVGNREEEHEVSEGDLILFPAGEEHWHGTSEDQTESFSHLYVICETTGTTTTPVE